MTELAAIQARRFTTHADEWAQLVAKCDNLNGDPAPTDPRNDGAILGHEDSLVALALAQAIDPTLPYHETSTNWFFTILNWTEWGEGYWAWPDYGPSGNLGTGEILKALAVWYDLQYHTLSPAEQIDAIEAMGASPVQYLVVPRFIACAIMLPILTTFANAIAIVGGYLLATSALSLSGGRTGMSGEFFWHMVTSARGFGTEDVLTGIVKSSTFGMIIATIGCYMGFTVAPASGAEGVGKATTACAVMSLVLILIADFLIEFIGHEVLGF